MHKHSQQRQQNFIETGALPVQKYITFFGFSPQSFFLQAYNVGIEWHLVQMKGVFDFSDSKTVKFTPIYFNSVALRNM